MMQAYGLTIQSAQALSDDQLRSVIANPAGPSAPAPPVEAAPAVSPERDALESSITGPILKAWGRGRKDVPGLSDDDLRAMIAAPGGPSTVASAPAEAPVASPPQPAEVPVVATEQATPPAPAASTSSAAPPPRPPSVPSQVGDAMEIIAREHFPIPPDVEEPYRLPNDVSKVSDEELRSLHARAHAVEARVNWVISQYDDELGDLERLIGDRRRVVKLETPASEDGKRLTKDQVEARIEADVEVVGLKEQIAGVKKNSGKLKLIRDNAHRDCERLSRQWSMRWKEEDKSPVR